MTYPTPYPVRGQSPVRVAVDLDDTLAKGSGKIDDPTIGALIPEGVALVRHYAAKGYEVVIHTSRPWSDYGRILEWVDANRLPIADIYCAKVLAGLYVDDKAYRPPYTEDKP